MTARPASVVNAADLPGEKRPRMAATPGVGAVVRTLGSLTGLTAVGVHLRSVPPGLAGTNRHFHSVEEEWAYVLSGRGQLRIGPLTFDVRPGCFAGFPPGPAPHHFINTGDEDLVFLEGGESRASEDDCWYPDTRQMMVARRFVEPYREPPPETGDPKQLVHIDDVPVVNITLWSKDLDQDGIADVDDGQLRMLAQDVLQSIKEIPDTGNGFVVGGRSEQVTVEVFPERLSGYGISLDQVANTIQTANSEQQAGGVESGSTHFTVMTGSFLKTIEDVSRLVVGTHNNVPVYVHDVARVTQGPEDAKQLVGYYTGPAADADQVVASLAGPDASIPRQLATLERQ